jgi:5-methylcytosine-specific restriction endonuclease McrA
MVQMLRRKLASLATGPAALATTATARTRGSSWQATRAQVMRRDAGLCTYCAPFGHLTPGAEVDHTRPLWAGGTDTPQNLRLVCRAHHRAKTRAEELTRQAGGIWSPWVAEPLKD